jgi:two-component system LytT family sensor kinase
MRFRKIVITTCIATGTIIPGLYVLQSIISKHSVNASHIILGICFSIILTIAISLVNYAYYTFLKKRYSNNPSQKKRIVLEFVFSTLFAIIVTYGIFMIFNFLFDFNNTIPNKALSLFSNMIISVVVNLIVFTVIEAIEWFNKWKLLHIESEQLKREKAESSYAALKNQVNPHFLFNSLNSLSSLIRVSPEKAIEFVDNFSRIYRYVLDVNDKLVVELKDELTFLNSYYFLQKIRFGNNLTIEVQVEAQKLNQYILPLSIQLLIENAIKHNEISSEYPLMISVFSEGDFLWVKNNLQKKVSTENSTGIGLCNIIQRYSHITETKPVFYIENNQYIAKIPLLTE